MRPRDRLLASLVNRGPPSPARPAPTPQPRQPRGPAQTSSCSSLDLPPPCCAFKIPSSSSRSPCSPRLPAHRAPRGGPARGARGSSTFHAECIKVPVNCALTSQGELGKAPRGLVLLGGPAGESITTWPQETAAQSVQGAGRGSRSPAPPATMCAQQAGEGRGRAGRRRPLPGPLCFLQPRGPGPASRGLSFLLCKMEVPPRSHLPNS